MLAQGPDGGSRSVGEMGERVVLTVIRARHPGLRRGGIGTHVSRRTAPRQRTALSSTCGGRECRWWSRRCPTQQTAQPTRCGGAGTLDIEVMREQAWQHGAMVQSTRWLRRCRDVMLATLCGDDRKALRFLSDRVDGGDAGWRR